MTLPTCSGAHETNPGQYRTNGNQLSPRWGQDLETTTITELLEKLNYHQAGERMFDLAAELYPICRSITGNGFRATLDRIGNGFALEVREVSTGTRVFDWTVPKEWNIRDAWIKNQHGEKVIDFQKSNLHVVSYSIPIWRKMPFTELREHLHTIPDHPEWIPYRTSYYHESWGFCLKHSEYQLLEDGEYEVCIDSRMEDGTLTYGECYLPGRRAEEILISCHACHPSLCNDNLSGVVLVACLASLLSGLALEYSYRFLFIPGTIGSITWLALNQENISRVKHGLVVACVGDGGGFHYKRSRRGNAEIDRAAVLALRDRPEGVQVDEFAPYGYDERQYCSPAFDLPVGCLSRTPHGRYPQYHTSADDLNLISAHALGGSLAAYLSVLRILEDNCRYVNLNPTCEPQLGKRGLYRATGGHPHVGQLESAMLWVLNLSDGNHALLDIAERAGMTFDIVHQAAGLLEEFQLLHRWRGTNARWEKPLSTSVAFPNRDNQPASAPNASSA